MGNALSRALIYIQTATALAAVAIAVAGCAGANNAASNQGEQPYKTMYGVSSEGTTTDLYTEIFGPRQPPPGPATNVASAQPVQPVTAQPAAPGLQPTTTTNRQGQTTVASRPPQPAYGQPAPVVQPAQVAQQPAAPPPEPDTPTAYGITANGPSTDLYTEIFGPRRSSGQ